MNDELVKLISFLTLNVIIKKLLKFRENVFEFLRQKLTENEAQFSMMQLAISKPREMSSKLVKDFGGCPRSRPFILNRTSVF